MAMYLLNIKDTNSWGGPFDRLWEVQEYVNEREYDPDDWVFTEHTHDRLNNPTRTKQRIDDNEIDVPCGEREFDDEHTDVYAFHEEDRPMVEVSVVAECTTCGFTHEASSVLTPTPK